MGGARGGCQVSLIELNIMKKLCLLILFCTLFLASCAHTAEKGTNKSRTLIFNYKIKGNFALSNPGVTYYVIIYSPLLPANTPLDTSKGPRVNGPILTKGSEFLEGRLPFTGLLTNDMESLWTDFFYLTGTPDGRGQVGRGKIQNNAPVIYDRTYPAEMWSVTENIFKLKINLNDLASQQNIASKDRKIPEKITMNLATGDNIDSGSGMLFDRWKANIPFALSTTSGMSERDEDITANLVMLVMPTRPYPQIPAGVNSADVDISGYETFIPQ